MLRNGAQFWNKRSALNIRYKGQIIGNLRGGIMNDFYTALNYVNKMIYEPNDLTVKSIQEEKQNSKYGAGTFQLSSRTVRFRVANITPRSEERRVGKECISRR